MGDYRRYGYRPGRAENSLSSFVVLGVFVLLLCAGIHALVDREKGRADAERMNVLRAEHGTIANTVRNTPTDHPARRGLEERLRDVTAEHNAILSRHPTWTQKPLDSLANTSDPYR